MLTQSANLFTTISVLYGISPYLKSWPKWQPEHSLVLALTMLIPSYIAQIRKKTSLNSKGHITSLHWLLSLQFT